LASGVAAPHGHFKAVISPAVYDMEINLLKPIFYSAAVVALLASATSIFAQGNLKSQPVACLSVGDQFSLSEEEELFNAPVTYGLNRFNNAWLLLTYSPDGGPKARSMLLMESGNYIIHRHIDNGNPCDKDAGNMNDQCSQNYHCDDPAGVNVSFVRTILPSGKADENYGEQGSLSSANSPFKKVVSSQREAVQWFNDLLSQIDGKDPIKNIADVMLLDAHRATSMLADGAQVSMTMGDLGFEKGNIILSNAVLPTEIDRGSAPNLVWKGFEWEPSALWSGTATVRCHIDPDDMPEVDHGETYDFEAKLIEISNQGTGGARVELACS